MMTHPYPCPRLIACTDTFLLHVYRSVSLARMRCYMQLAYLFHQYEKSLLSTDGRIADCTVRHPGVERPFSSYLNDLIYFVICLLQHFGILLTSLQSIFLTLLYLVSVHDWFCFGWKSKQTNSKIWHWNNLHRVHQFVGTSSTETL